MKKGVLFNKVAMKRPGYNTFDLSHDVKMSGKMGQLLPVACIECVPGDRFNLSCDNLIRFAPMVAPVMHRMDCYIHYFFVPNRIIWPNWEKFIVNEETGGLPSFTLNDSTGAWTSAARKFMGYFGIPDWDPATENPNLAISALPFAAYQKIYTDYYRDQNLIQTNVFGIGDGDTLDADGNLQILADGLNTANRVLLTTQRIRSWEHDYFTSALPFAQKGDAVDLPLGDVRLKADWENNLTDPLDGAPGFRDTSDTITTGDITQTGTAGGSILVGAGIPNAYDPNGTLETTPTTINDLRRAFRLQEWLEKNARGGTRYIENILAHFGVRSSDKRLQRPEYITGTKSPVIISEVLNTAGVDTATSPVQGNMAGHGVSVGKGYKGSYFCEEHGYIIGIASIMPRTAYQQGVPRTFSKFDPFDYYWPSFAHLGEQEILLKELYMDVNGVTNENTFGYNPRYAEYKYMPSRVAGDFRTTFNYWHLGRIFANAPALNKQFLELVDNDVLRIFAVQDGSDYLWMHFQHHIKARRPMPVFGTPML